MRQNGELERALDTLEEMQRRSIAPSVATLGLVFDMAVLFKEPKIAYDILQQAAASHEHETFHTHATRMHHELLRCAATTGSVSNLHAHDPSHHRPSFPFRLNSMRW